MAGNKKQTLYLHEEIMLLVLSDKLGTPEFGAMYAQAMGGGILAELVMTGRVEIEEGSRGMVNLIDGTPLGDAIIAEALRKVRTAKRRAAATTWVQRFAGLHRMHHRVALELCKKGILKADEQNVLLIFNRTVYPELDPKPEQEMKERLERAIFTDTDKIDPRTAILISLAHAADLLRIYFKKAELKKQKKRIEQITQGELMGKATKEAVQAAQAAMMVAAIMPSIMAATIVSVNS